MVRGKPHGAAKEESRGKRKGNKIADGEDEKCAATLEDSLMVSYKTILLPQDPAITFLGIYPKKLKSYVPIKTCTQQLYPKTWK